MRFVTGRPLALTHSFTDDDVTLTVGSATVTLTDNTGATVHTGPMTASGQGFTVSIPAKPLGVYTATYTGGGYTDIEVIEVVGARLFTVSEARNLDDQLLNPADVDSATIKYYRDMVEYEFERITRVSFFPRVARFTITPDGDDILFTPFRHVDSIVSVANPDGPVTDHGLSINTYGMVSGLSAHTAGVALTVVVDYGLRDVPPTVKRAGVNRVRTLLSMERGSMLDRATSVVGPEGGNYTLATPGRAGYETGIPEVDAELARWTFKITDDLLGGM